MLHVILGGAALQRCDSCIVFNAASAAEVTLLTRGRVFTKPPGKSSPFRSLELFIALLHYSSPNTTRLLLVPIYNFPFTTMMFAKCGSFGI